MALQVSKYPRTFTFKKDNKDVILQDPNPELSPEEVMKFYSSSHPELTNAVIEGPTVVNDKTAYTMSTKAGKLG